MSKLKIDKPIKVGVIGLPIQRLEGDPQLTLLGNPMRSWALFERLPNYGFETYLHVKSNCEVDESIDQHYGERIVKSREKFIELANNEFDFVVICGTRIQVTLSHYPWINELANTGTKVVLAQCYHNDPALLEPEFVEKIVAAGFVTPKFSRQWAAEYPNIPTYLLTTGQNSKPSQLSEPDGSVVFVGHVHNWDTFGRLIRLAKIDKEHQYHVVSSSIRTPGGEPGDYTVMSSIEEGSRQEAFDTMCSDAGFEACPNIVYHHLPPGEEDDLLEKASIGIDFSWSKQWKIDNSKICYYLSYGLAPITELPSPSYRFIDRFGVGNYFRFAESPEIMLEAVNKWRKITREEKNELREKSASIFDWENVAFEVAEQINMCVDS